MSDFLTNLAARTLGAVPVVKPRQRSRFEPDSNADPLSELREIAAETHASTSRPDPNQTAGAHVGFRPAAPITAQKSAIVSPSARPSSPSAEPAHGIAGRRMDVAHAEIESTSHRALSTPRDHSREAPAPPRLVAQPTTQLTQRLIERAAASPVRSEAKAAPSIHVSIGRVEVRAIHRPDKPAPPPAAPTPPRTSLGSYLRGSRGPRE